MAIAEHTEPCPSERISASDVLDEVLRAQAILGIYRRSLEDDQHAEDIYLLDTVGTILDKAGNLADRIGLQHAQEVSHA